MKTPPLILFLLILTACGLGKKNDNGIIDRTDRKIKVVVNATVLENDVFEVCENVSIDFTNTSVNATAFEWHINNEILSTSTDFTHTFANAGTYIVKIEFISFKTIVF